MVTGTFRCSNYLQHSGVVICSKCCWCESEDSFAISTFAKIREGDYCYADKTGFISIHVDCGTYFFISRPRRFGKSLFIDTLRDAFSCNKKLFTGLALENTWNWEPSVSVGFYDFVGCGRLCGTTEKPYQERVRSTHRLRRPLTMLFSCSASQLSAAKQPFAKGHIHYWRVN